MPLVLRIENVDTLPDGGPVFVEIDRRGIDIGRDTFLDWTLPDPERFISGKHCEIHFRDGGYWLHDVSTNGTSINGQPGRVTEPHKLQNGDRIHIGPYIVLTELSGVEAGPGTPGPVPDKGGTSVGSDPWGGLENTAEAIDRRDFTARSRAAGGERPADLAEENISWGFGDMKPTTDAEPGASEWGAPSAPAPSAAPAAGGADWGAGPASEPEPEPSTTPAADGSDWGAAPAPTPDPAPASDAAEWGAPPEAPPQTPSKDASDWGAPPSAEPPESAPPESASSAAGSAMDWGGTPAADDAGGGGSPWDFSPEPAATPEVKPATPVDVQPAPEAAPKPDEAAGDNPFLAETPPASETPVEPVAPPISEGGSAFGELSDTGKSAAEDDATPSASPAVDEAKADVATPPPAAGLGGQWAGGEPEAAPPAAPKVAVAPAGPAGDGSFIAAFERGAGLPAGSIADRSDEALAQELGELFRTMTQSLQAMLLARAETKSAMRSSERTMIGALENNPLKFSPTPEDALRIMFGQKSRSYLDASQTIEHSFSDLQKHQMQTFGAMQSALQVLIEDLDPETIAGATAKDGGLAALVSSRRAKFWDTYVERFKAKSAHHDRGMIDAFMILFAEMYDRQS